MSKFKLVCPPPPLTKNILLLETNIGDCVPPTSHVRDFFLIDGFPYNMVLKGVARIKHLHNKGLIKIAADKIKY